VAKEKDVVLNELALNNDEISRWFDQKLFAAAYDHHPYRWPVVGIAERFRTITRQDVVDYHAARYRPENIIFSVAGDFDRKAVMDAVMAESSTAPVTPASAPVIEAEPRQMGYRFSGLTRADATLSRVTFAWRSVSTRSADMYPLDVLSIMLGSGKPSVLNRELKEKRLLVQEISCFSYTPGDPGLFGIDALLEDRHYAEVTNILFRMVRDIPRYLTQANLDRAKNLILNSRITSLQTVDGQSSSMAVDEALTGDPDFSLVYIDKVQSLTLVDLKAAVRKYLVRDSLTVLVLRPPQADQAKAGQSGRTNDARAANAVRMERTVLGSGLRVLYVYKTNLPLLNLKFLVRGGVLLDAGRPGLDRFVNEALVKGNSKYPGVSAYEAIEAVGGSLDNYAGNNSAGVTVQLLDKDASLGLDVLYHAVRDASFRPGDVEKVRQDLVNAVEQQSENLFQSGLNCLRRLMYADHPYRHPADGTVASLRSITPRDLKRFYREHYSSADGLLVVTGRVTPALKRKVSSVFGGFRRGAKVPQVASSRAGPAPGTGASFRTNFGKQRSLVLIGYPLPSITNAARYDIEVLTGVLSGLGSRLFVRLRDIQHLGYQVGASPAFMLDQGFFFFYVTTERPDEAEAGLKREIRNLRNEPFTPAEISMARNDILGDYLTGEQAWDSLALTAGLEELYTGDYRKYFAYPAAVASADAARLAAVSARLFEGGEKIVVLRGGSR
jgi:zinc protease